MIPTLIGNLYVDSVDRKSFSEPLTVTDAPIEDGSRVASHIVNEKAELRLECSFGDDNMTYYGADNAAVKALQWVFTAEDKKQAIWEIKDNKELIDVIMPNDDYRDMILRDIIEDESLESGNSYQCTCILQKMKIAKTKKAKVVLNKIKKKKSAKKDEDAKKMSETEDQGKVPSTEVQGEQETTILGALVAAIS